MEDEAKIKNQLIDELNEARQRIAEFESSEIGYKGTENRLVKELTAIDSIVDDMLDKEKDSRETEKRVIDACLSATNSVYGMMGVINEHGEFDTTTYCGQALQDCAFSDALAWELTKSMTIRGIWGWPLLHGESILCNDLHAHPDRVGFPSGHVPIECFLGVPLKQDGKVVGMVAVANRPGGYTEEDRVTLVNLASVVGVSRQYRRALLAEKRTSVELEQLVAERTRELQESEKRYKRLVESSPDIIYEASTKEGDIFFSKRIEDILGYPAADFVGRSNVWRDSIHPKDLPKVESALEILASKKESEKAFAVEYRIKDKRGRWHWLQDESFGHRIVGEEVVIDGIARDITERRKAEQRVQKELEEKKILLSEIHHRVKNNLQIINSLLNLQARKVKNKIAIEIISECRDRVRSMALIHDMMYTQHRVVFGFHN